MIRRHPAPSIDIKEYLNYDPKSGVFTWVRYRNPMATPGRIVTLLDPKGYLIVGWQGRNYRAHRLAWWWVSGDMPDCEIDHINGVRDDNRFINLRPATSVQNNHNRKTPVSNTSGVKGVSWSRTHNAWVARVAFRGVRHQAGYFKGIADAEVAVRSLREKLHKEFANHGTT